MIGHIAAATRLYDFDALGFIGTFRKQQVFSVGFSSQRHDGRVLQEKEGIGRFTRHHGVVSRQLKRQRGRIALGFAEADGFELTLSHFQEVRRPISG